MVLSLVAVSSSDTKINTSLSFAQTTPSVAMDTNGDSVVAWVQAANINQYDIEIQVYNPAGVAQLATPVTVERHDEPQLSPDRGDGLRRRLRRRLARL